MKTLALGLFLRASNAAVVRTNPVDTPQRRLEYEEIAGYLLNTKVTDYVSLT